MHSQPNPAADAARRENPAEWRKTLREAALRDALRKRELGVPTYKVTEAAALLSVSPEYLHRLIQTSKFPAVRLNGAGGRSVVSAELVEHLLKEASTAPAVSSGGAA